MRPRRLAILILVIVALCLAGFVTLISGLPQTSDNVTFAAGGIQTNGSGARCVLIMMTNRSDRAYSVAFAIQSKSAGSWGNPSLIRASDVGQLEPRGVRGFLVPVGATATPWRVVGTWAEKVPSSRMGRFWHNLPFPWWRRPLVILFTCPEMSSNQSIEPTGGSRLCLSAFLIPWPLPPVAHARRSVL